MKKFLNKILTNCLILFIVFSIFSNVFASNLKTSLNIIQKASETKYLENNQGYISKTIVDSNSNNGEVTIELKLSNTKKETEQTTDTEVFLVVDNSPSMDFVTSTGETRKEIILNSATQLVESIFNISSNVKVGLVDFHGASSGLLGESASIYNATVRQKLTTDKNTMVTAINNELERSTDSGTNIEAGLKIAQKNFSTTANNKVIILLTDGIPNASVDGTSSSNDVTTEKAILIQNNTKQALLDLKTEGIYTITMLTGMSESDGNTDKEGTEYIGSTIEENLAAAERVFGTQTNPIADKYYLAKSADINNVITNDVLKDVSNKIQNPINTVKIVDYFPKDITDNFEFSYVGSPSVGTTSDTIDAENKTITWDVGTLKGDEVATLKYKLKIKDMQNTSLLNKTISTNEKVVLTYKDTDSKDYTVTLTSSPKIQLAEVKEEKTTNNTSNQNSEDTTTAKGVLPKTGISITIIFVILLIVVFSILAYKKYNSYKDIK
jgi:hypothetical protein